MYSVMPIRQEVTLFPETIISPVVVPIVVFQPDPDVIDSDVAVA